MKSAVILHDTDGGVWFHFVDEDLSRFNDVCVLIFMRIIMK